MGYYSALTFSHELNVQLFLITYHYNSSWIKLKYKCIKAVTNHNICHRTSCWKCIINSSIATYQEFIIMRAHNGSNSHCRYQKENILMTCYYSRMIVIMPALYIRFCQLYLKHRKSDAAVFFHCRSDIIYCPLKYHWNTQGAQTLLNRQDLYWMYQQFSLVQAALQIILLLNAINR